MSGPCQRTKKSVDRGVDGNTIVFGILETVFKRLERGLKEMEIR